MSRDDQIRGTRVQGINHLLHNHALGIVPNFFLARYDISHRRIYEAFDRLLLGELPGFEIEDSALLERFRAVILGFSQNIGLDEYLFYRTISELVWFTQGADGERTRADSEVRKLVQAFYRALRQSLGICASPWEQRLLEELVDFGLLMAPKPGWSSPDLHNFEFDVQQIWLEIYEEIIGDQPDAVLVDGEVPLRRSKVRAQPGEWQQVARQTRQRLAALLSDERLLGLRRSVSFKARNPWVAPPSKDNCDWLLSSRSKRVELRRMEAAAE
jgi:hypothetical protein